MIQGVFDRMMTGVSKRATDSVASAAAASKQQEPLHTQGYANRAHSAGECKTRTAQKAHVESAKNQAKRLIESGSDHPEMVKRDVLGNLLVVVQDNRAPGDWAIRACLQYMNSQNSMTKGLALLTHGKLLDLMPPEKRGSELLAAVQCVATSLRSIDEIEVQYALKYIAACWDADLVGNILGSPYQARRVAVSSAAENVALLTILLPDAAEAAKPALASACTQKHALAALTSLVQKFGSQVDDSIDLVDVTRALCAKHLGHASLALPAANLLRAVVTRRAHQGRLSECAPLATPLHSAVTTACARSPTPHHLVQQLAAVVAALCEAEVSAAAAESLKALLVAASRGTSAAEDHELCNAMGSVAQVVCAIAALPGSSQAVTGLQGRAVVATRAMFEKAKSQSKKPSAWRNPNNLRYEGLRCIIALQANKPSVAVPFREDVVLCLRSADASLRLLAAEVLYNSCSADNLTGIADQFLLIIRSTVDATIKADFARKIARLVETYAQPAEYARTMASVLDAAGPAAPKDLASQVASTVALCGERDVQTDTARVFHTLLKSGETLSEAQLLVAFWVTAEFGDRAGISAPDAAAAIAAATRRQKLSGELQAAALTALFKVTARAGAGDQAPLEKALGALLKEWEPSRNVTLSRLAAITSAAVSAPDRFQRVAGPAEDTPLPPSEDAISLPALDALAAEQAAAGQPAYAPFEERSGLFSHAQPRASPTLRTAQYEAPAVGGGAAAAAAQRAPTAVGAAAAMPAAAGSPTGAAAHSAGARRPRPQTQARFGTFSNMMAPPPAAVQPATISDPAPASADLLGGGADGGQDAAPAASDDALADMLFGGGSAGKAAARSQHTSAPAAPPPAPAAPLSDLLGGLDEAPPAPDAARAAAPLDDLFGSPTAAPTAAEPVDDPFADFTTLDASAPRPAGDALPDLMSGLDVGPPRASGPADTGLGDLGELTSNGASVIQQPVADDLFAARGVERPMVVLGGTQRHVFELPAGAAAPPPAVPAGASTAEPAQAALGGGGVNRSGTLQAKPPQKKGDAFSDLLNF